MIPSDKAWLCLVGDDHSPELSRRAQRRRRQERATGTTAIDPGVQNAINSSPGKTWHVEGGAAFMCAAQAIRDALDAGAEAIEVDLENIRTLKRDDSIQARKEALSAGLEYQRPGLSTDPRIRITHGRKDRQRRHASRSRRG